MSKQIRLTVMGGAARDNYSASFGIRQRANNFCFGHCEAASERPKQSLRA